MHGFNPAIIKQKRGFQRKRKSKIKESFSEIYCRTLVVPVSRSFVASVVPYQPLGCPAPRPPEISPLFSRLTSAAEPTEIKD